MSAKLLPQSGGTNTKRPPRSSRTTRHRKTPDPAAAVIGARVRALRYAHGFNFDAFVEETGLGRGYVSELERGLVVPTIHTLAKIARALELTVADLVLGETERELLFGELRDVPLHVVQEVRTYARRIGAYQRAGTKMLDVADSAPRPKRRNPREDK